MSLDKVHFRHCLLYEFKLGHKATEAHGNLCAVFGEDIPSERQCQNWFKKFRDGDFSIEDEPRPGRPIELDLDAFLDLLRNERRLSTREMASILGCSQPTIVHYLNEFDFVQKYGYWIPHKLTKIQKEQRVTICNSLLSRRNDKEWIKQIVTGDEKWVLYINYTRKRQWVLSDETPEPDVRSEPHAKKVMLSVFWDYKGILWYELLPTGTTVNAVLYRTQMDKLAGALKNKRPERSRVFCCMITLNPTQPNSRDRKSKNWDGKFCLTLHIVQTSPLQIFIFSALYLTSSKRSTSTISTIWKMTSKLFSSQKLQSSMLKESSNCHNVGRWS